MDTSNRQLKIGKKIERTSNYNPRPEEKALCDSVCRKGDQQVDPKWK